MTDPDEAEREEIEFQRLYGPWQPARPSEVAALLGDFHAPWWIAGGWAIEAFTGRSRHHEDVDVAMFRRDLPLLRAALAGRYHLWSAGARALRPVDDHFPDLHDGASQVWVRAHSGAPWVADIVMNDDRDGLWVDKRWPDHVAAYDEVTWVADDGIRYQSPEIAIFFKARLSRPKDEVDLAATWPLLDATQRAWVTGALEATEPAHPWLERWRVGPE